jgi:hypothetical protein
MKYYFYNYGVTGTNSLQYLLEEKPLWDVILLVVAF